VFLCRATVSSAVLLCVSSLCLGQGTTEFLVIVSPDNPAVTISAPELSDIFLKRKLRWSNGAAIQPVDLSGEPKVREAFSGQIHQRTTSNIKSFWNQQVFSGRGVSPTELGSSLDVVQYVAAHPGAVGYVAPGVALDGVKVIGVLMPPRVIHRVEPEYPAAALSAHAGGDVVLSVQVEKDGSVSRVTVVKDLPFGLSREAVRAVGKWRFDPATVNGKPVAQAVEVTVHFSAQRE